MDAIETLMNEHRTIERVLDALTGFVDEVQRTRSTQKEELAQFVAFIRDYADAFHHGKEEDVLFEAMIEAGFPREGGPVAVMLHEHDQGRALVGVLAERAAQAEAWSDEHRQDVVGAAHGFAGLLRNHIHKEDAILYPMAEQRLPAELLEDVGAQCAALDAAKAATGERLVALAEALVSRHAANVHPSARPTPRLGCCG